MALVYVQCPQCHRIDVVQYGLNLAKPKNSAR